MKPPLSSGEISDDWREFFALLLSHRVRFVVVGGHAVAVHARPRNTEDLDLFVEPSHENAARVLEVLRAFGFGSVAPDLHLLAEPGRAFFLGRKPQRIDLLTAIAGVTFEQAWAGRITVRTQFGELPVLGRAELLINKRAAGRPKDLADVRALTAASPTRAARPGRKLT